MCTLPGRGASCLDAPQRLTRGGCAHRRQTTSIAAGGSRNLCLIVGGLLLVLGVLGFALQLVAEDGVTMAGAVLSYVGAVAGFVLILYARISIRQRKNLQGSGLGDCCASFWCSPCSICQVRKGTPQAAAPPLPPPSPPCTAAHHQLPCTQMLNEFAPYRGPFAGYEVLDEEQAGATVAKA